VSGDRIELSPGLQPSPATPSITFVERIFDGNEFPTTPWGRAYFAEQAAFLARNLPVPFFPPTVPAPDLTALRRELQYAQEAAAATAAAWDAATEKVSSSEMYLHGIDHRLGELDGIETRYRSELTAELRGWVENGGQGPAPILPVPAELTAATQERLDCEERRRSALELWEEKKEQQQACARTMAAAQRRLVDTAKAIVAAVARGIADLIAIRDAEQGVSKRLLKSLEDQTFGVEGQLASRVIFDSVTASLVDSIGDLAPGPHVAPPAWDSQGAAMASAWRAFYWRLLEDAEAEFAIGGADPPAATEAENE
jgi:hypothetical protein